MFNEATEALGDSWGGGRTLGTCVHALPRDAHRQNTRAEGRHVDMKLGTSLSGANDAITVE